MGLTGKYDFDGIKTQGALGLRALFSAFAITAWLPKLPLSKYLFDLLANLLANRGLVFLNVGAIYVEGHFDQKALDSALDAGIKRMERAEATGEVIPPEEGQALDQAVMDAANKAIPYGKPPKPKS